MFALNRNEIKMISQIVISSKIKYSKRVYAFTEQGVAVLYDFKFRWVREADGGNWYYSEDFQMEGWLCPALFKYFDNAPEEIYAKFEDKEERGQGVGENHWCQYPVLHHSNTPPSGPRRTRRKGGEPATVNRELSTHLYPVPSHHKKTLADVSYFEYNCTQKGVHLC
jgi:hypothetical protein